jgi:hypothetical protein
MKIKGGDESFLSLLLKTKKARREQNEMKLEGA